MKNNILMNIRCFTAMCVESFANSNLLANKQMDEQLAISIGFVNYFTNNNLKNLYAISHDENIARDSFIVCSLIQATVICDLYLLLKRKYFLSTISNHDLKLLKRTIKALQENNLRPLLGDVKIVDNFIEASLEMLDASAYEKVEMYKNLKEEEVELLSSINPYIKKEYEVFNVTLDRHLIITQIKKWLKAYNDEDLALTKAAEFLIHMFKIDHDDNELFIEMANLFPSELFMQALLDEDIEVTKGFMKEYFHRYNTEGPKLS